MGPAPTLAQYQAAAQSIYAPQQAADAASLKATNTTTKNTLEAEKGQIGTNYQSAINNLNSSVQDRTGSINQLYTERLGGNFSGLQGNDLGMMYAKANQQQGIIESTRANALNNIAVQEGNADITYNTNLNNLGSMYQSKEAQYANAGYDSAMKSYQAQQLEQERIAQAQANSDRNYALAVNRASSSRAPRQSSADVLAQNMASVGNMLVNKAGKDGHVSQGTWNAAMAKWLEAGGSAKDFTNNYIQFVNQRYGGYHGFD